MKTYHFARIDGETPVHLVGYSENGPRVQALAPLEGPDHNLFLAIDGADLEAASAFARSLPVPGLQVTESISICDTLPCQEVIDFIQSLVAELYGFAIYLYLLLEVEGRLHHLSAVREALGEHRVAAITNGRGRVLIELGGDDQAELEAQLKAIRELPNVKSVTAHWARQKHRA